MSFYLEYICLSVEDEEQVKDCGKSSLEFFKAVDSCFTNSTSAMACECFDKLELETQFKIVREAFQNKNKNWQCKYLNNFEHL